MGKRGNQGRQQSRRVREALARQDKNLAEAVASSTDGGVLTATFVNPLDKLDDAIPWCNDLNYPGSSPDEALAAIDSSIDGKTKRRITLMKDHTLDYPELYIDVWVVGPPQDRRGFAQMFARSGCKKAKSLADADLVVFTGGDDVNPALYGEEAHSQTKYNDERDTSDINDYVYCLENGIPMFGVCRGAQFLHVMNGGKLYQHVDNHFGHHSMVDIHTKQQIDLVSSVHHQMVIPQTSMKLLATANKARNRWRNMKENDMGTRADVEAFFYKDTCCLGVQGHPEYSGFNYFTVWTLKKIEEYIAYNLDVTWTGPAGDQHLRLKPDCLEQAKMNIGVTATLSKGVK